MNDSIPVGYACAARRTRSMPLSAESLSAIAFDVALVMTA
jgi:hypothetical protein